MAAREEESRLRLRKLNKIDVKEQAKKEKSPKGKKIKPVFRVVRAASDDDTRAVEEECDEGDMEDEVYDGAAHESDDEERPPAK